MTDQDARDMRDLLELYDKIQERKRTINRIVDRGDTVNTGVLKEETLHLLRVGGTAVLKELDYEISKLHFSTSTPQLEEFTSSGPRRITT